jgi:hypothetical protein
MLPASSRQMLSVSTSIAFVACKLPQRIQFAQQIPRNTGAFQE